MEKLREGLIKIDPHEILPVANKKMHDGWRLAQMACCLVKEQYEITYNFAKGYKLETYRIVIPRDGEVESISRIYSTAMFYENEMSELFGCRIVNMKIDLKNKFLRIEEDTPFVKKEAE